MALATPCQTPGAVYHTRIQDDRITVEIDLGHDLILDDESAAILEANLHNAVELVLARFA